MVSLGRVEDGVGAVIDEGHEGKLLPYSTMKVSGISFKLVSNLGSHATCGLHDHFKFITTAQAR
jgi:hypothetical protein